MKSQATTKFWKFYIRLPRSVQQHARNAYQIWKENPRHPSLHFKRVDDKEPIYSVRVRDEDEISSTSRRIDLGHICSSGNNKS